MAKGPITTTEKAKMFEMLVDAQRASADILRCLYSVQEGKEIYAVRHRIKSADGIQEKIVRKRHEGKRSYKLKDVTDILGLRFITLYRDDIPIVAERVLQVLLGVSTDGASPFSAGDLKEFRVYISHANPDRDPLVVSLKDINSRYQRLGHSWSLEVVPLDRYSSVHFVSTVSVLGKTIRIPVEIQVRSAFEDVWGEVDHGLLYKQGQSAEAFDPAGRALINRQMGYLKMMMDAAAGFADSMRDSSTIERRPTTIEMKESLDGIKYITEVCDKIGAPEGVVKRFMDLLHRKERIDQQFRDMSRNATPHDYIRLANNFADMLLELERTGGFLHGRQKKLPERELSYLIQMEESVCRLLSLDRQQLYVAIPLLQRVTKGFPDHPVAWLRLGEAYAGLMDVPIGDRGPAAERAYLQGREAYKRAKQETQQLPNRPNRFFLGSGAQEEYIKNHVGRLHSFLVWRASSLRRNDPGASDADTLKGLKDAFCLALEALDETNAADARERILNNIVYFGAEILSLERKISAQDGLPCDAAQYERFVSELEKLAKSEGEAGLRVWDTIAYARLMLSGREAADPAATRVLHAYYGLNRNPDRPLTDYSRWAYESALHRALEIKGYATR